MPTLNYTTSVPVTRTLAEVQHMLAEHGADAVAVRFTDKQPVGVSFTLATAHGPRAYTLPVNVAGVHRLLIEQHRARRGVQRAQTTPEHAARVAWRVLKDWLAAQLAIIDARMASLDQVMLPYLHAEPGSDRTLYELFQEREQRAIDAAG